MRTALGLWIILLLGLGPGCTPLPEDDVPDQENPYLQTGKKLAEARDYKGAIRAFERALAMNPRSVRAHYELAVLYEQHSKQKEQDYVTAMYHYFQVLKLRPKGYPADNARQRLLACKQELLKAESLAPVAHQMVAELDRLRKENAALRQTNAALRREIQGWQRYYASLQAAGRVPPAAPRRSAAAARRSPAPAHHATRAPRRHIVLPGETLYSISRRYGITVKALKAANPTVNERRLQVGTALRIPSR